MAAYPNSLAAYRKVASHGGVAAADAHGLIVMLLDGALERIAIARGAIENGRGAEKAMVIHRAVAIVDELRNSLDLRAGGQLAANLDDLYDYCCRRLLRGSLDNSVAALEEVAALLQQIRAAWLAVPAEARAGGTAR